MRSCVKEKVCEGRRKKRGRVAKRIGDRGAGKSQAFPFDKPRVGGGEWRDRRLG